MDTLDSYYRDNPLERLERNIYGLEGLGDLLKSVCSADSDLSMVKPSGLATLVEIIHEDMAQAMADFYKLKKSD